LTVNLETATLRVKRVRKRGSRAAVFSALAIDSAGAAVPTAPRYAVMVPHRLLAADVQEGQWWRVSGSTEDVSFDVDGWRVHERRLHATKVELLRPSGEHIVQLLARSPAFPGIGEVKARRLWEALGTDVYAALDQGDHDRIAGCIGAELATVLLDGWSTYGDADAVAAFQKMGLDLTVSQKVLAAYCSDALATVSKDPFRLLAFGLSWPAADQLARGFFGVPAEDERRLGAAVESVLYTELDRGNTCASFEAVRGHLERLVGKTHSDEAVRLALARHYVVEREGKLHALGPWSMERLLSDWLVGLAAPSPPLVEPAAVDVLIDQYERAETVETGATFSLNTAQRDAVRAASNHRLVLITGGAGVGKTTVLKCIRSMLDASGQTVYQMALSGRAAKRMAEATGKPSMTIAGFLRNVAKEGLPERCTVVVDEASMLDVLLAYRLVGALPEDARLILIGDPFQLPPVGPGLTLHALTDIPQLAKVELTVVRRFGGDIAAVASAVRNGCLPELPSSDDADVTFIECDADQAGEVVLGLLSKQLAETQVLTFTKEKGSASSAAINTLCQKRLAAEAKRLVVFNDERNRLEDTGFRLGDPVLCTKNLWHLGLQNGSLGRLHAIEDVPLVGVDGVATYAWVRWDDGELRGVTDEVLDALELGYAITVHKAQGSQFSRVVVPVFKARNLDRTMLYTAITRATRQVLLVGDRSVAAQVVASAPSASRRQVALGSFIKQAFAEH
jgi:exodeoxyribonuclease V alpha subunit